MAQTTSAAPAHQHTSALLPRGFRLLLLVGIACFAGATALTVLAAHDGGPLTGDVRFARELQSIPVGDFTQSTRNMNNYEAVLLAGSIAIVGLWYARRRQQAAVLAGGLLLLLVFTLFIKGLVDRPRPDPALINVLYEGRSPSFPSGHVISSSTLFGYLLYIAAGARVRIELRWLVAVAFSGLALANGLGTIHSGAHWPSDVLGGYLWAVVLVVLLIAADRAFAARYGPDASRPWTPT